MSWASGGRLLVVSPHCDDAVLSLGGLLADHVGRGGTATVLTVLAGDRASSASAGPWDAAAGFRTAGEAALARQAEDLEACRILGVQPVHLPGLDQQYRGTAALDGLDEVVRRAGEHDLVLMPGYPLRHPDHAAVTRTLLPLLADQPVRLYAEEPYASWSTTDPWTELQLTLRPRPTALARKVRAVACYRSQLRQLGAPFSRPWLGPRAALMGQLLWAARRPGERLSRLC